MKLNVPLFLGICAVFCGWSSFPVANAMLGRNVQQVPEGQYTFVASLMHFNLETENVEENHICTAAIFSSKAALVAAHCIIQRCTSETVVAVGSVNLAHARRYGIAWWITFMQWSEMRQRRTVYTENDIAVVKLSRSLDENIIPGVLSPLRNRDFRNLDLVIAGWGITASGQMANTMLMGQVKVLHNRDCEERMSRLANHRRTVHLRYLCTAADPFILINRGDDGGPLIYNNMIVGINKESAPLASVPNHPEKVNIHTGIEYYRDFIADVSSNDFRWR